LGQQQFIDLKIQSQATFNRHLITAFNCFSPVHFQRGKKAEQIKRQSIRAEKLRRQSTLGPWQLGLAATMAVDAHCNHCNADQAVFPITENDRFGYFCVYCGWWGFDPLRMDSPPTDEIRSTFARKRATTLPIFTLEIDGRPTLVFETAGPAEAREICLDADLRADLSSLTSGGIPICPDDATLSSRPAVQEEIAAYKHAVKLAPPTSDEHTMAFLIK
jgi:hypothetical protein